MTNNSSNSKTPAYARFCTALTARFAALDIPLTPAQPDSKDGWFGPDGWVCFQVVGTGDKVYAKRTKNGDPSVIETTVPFELIPGSLIVKDMRDLNGKIEARVKPDVEALASGLLPVLASRLRDGASLRASKAPTRRASGQSAPAATGATVAALVGASLAPSEEGLSAEQAAGLDG